VPRSNKKNVYSDSDKEGGLFGNNLDYNSTDTDNIECNIDNKNSPSKKCLKAEKFITKFSSRKKQKE